MTKEEFIKTISVSFAKRDSQVRSERIRAGIKAKKEREMKMIARDNPVLVNRVSRISKN